MSLERIWKDDHKRRTNEEERRRRVRLNWPGHAKRIAKVFRQFADITKKNGIAMYVNEHSGDFREACRLLEDSCSSAPWGAASISLSFGNKWTGEGVITKTEHGTNKSADNEIGARLVVHYSSADGVIQVFLDPPYISGPTNSAEKSDELLIKYTYNTDDLTERWAEKLIKKLLVLNRVESIFLRPSAIDKLMVRLWRFLDIRNRRGYLDAFRHFFTPWELVMLAAAAFAVSIWVSVG